MKSFKDIREARGDTCVFTFGRFNPPTTGHEKLLDKVASVAKANPGAPYYVFASHSENPKKDPLPYSKKVAYMKKMFPKHARNIIVDKARNVFEIAVSLHNKGHKAIVMVVGSDRVSEFESLLNKYNGVEARHGFYGFDNIEVVSAGERDPDAEGVTGMSASKMRAAASANDFEQFKLGLPKGFGQGDKLFKDVRKHMGIRESFIPMDEVLTEEDIFRDMYVRGDILTIGEEVTDSYSGVTGKVIRRGTNYITFAEEDGTTHKKWLYELQEMTTGQLIKHVMAKTTKKKGYDKAVEILKSVIDRKMADNNGKLKHTVGYYAQQVARTFRGLDGRELAKAYDAKYEDCWAGYKQVGMKKKGDKEVPNCVPEGVKQDKEIKDREGTQPAKYYAKDAEGDDMSKSTKQARARHFEKGKKGPAPGDKSAKTKPSKYTKKYQQMFGDKDEQLDEKIEGLVNKSEKSGISYSILKKVYDRGMAAYKTGHRPGATAQQWAFARVNSFITGGKTRTTADADLWKQHKGKSEDYREVGTNARRENVQNMTPGQKVVSFKEHTKCGTPDCCNQCETSNLIESNIYRVGSEMYYEFFNEKRKLYESGELNLQGHDKELIEGDIGKFAVYEGENVPLDCPMVESEYQGKDVELNKPKAGGPKKYYVYVKDPQTGNIKKVTWGDTTGLKVKLSDKDARKSFAARHKCDQQKDKTKAAYWACNLPRYAKQLGLSGGGNFFW